MKSIRSWRVASRLVVSLFVACIVTPSVALGLAGARAGADAPLSGFYLDLGGSASVGYQPTYLYPHGQPTTYGYANDVVSYEASRGVALDLTELGCPDETTTTMINGGDRCYHEDGSQLADAMSFLRANQGEEGIVTIDLGFNDLRGCLHLGANAQSCLDGRMTDLQEQLPFILKSLQGVANAGVSFVGLGFDDPYLADALTGPTGARFASHSEADVEQLNDALSAVYASVGIPMATVSSFFNSENRTKVDLEGVGTVPENVANACELTWMCAPKPYGPNLHPNNAGYFKIADAIESELQPPW
jgi:GDSL-like Lipase/Acylhydrolase family